MHGAFTLLARRFRFAIGASAAALFLQQATLLRAIDPALSPAPTATPDPARPKAHPTSADVKSELTGVIDAQLAAFRANDFPKAYTFAATGIREMFTQAEFESMVRKSYGAIVHSTDVDYGMSFDTGEDAVIYVRVIDTATKTEGQYQYLLKKENGTWKIGGVSAIKSDGLSV